MPPLPRPRSVIALCLLATLLLVSCSAGPGSPSPPPSGDGVPADTQEPTGPGPTVVILDASGSMNADDAPGPRIDAAKRAVRTLVEGMEDGAEVGLVVYGTGTGNAESDKPAGCLDITTVLPVTPLDRAAFTAASDAVVASGYTPIASALRHAAAQLPTDSPATVILVSDGEDTCSPPPPCDIARQLHQSHPQLVVHTVGFKVAAEVGRELACVAEATGGFPVDADNAAQLQARLAATRDPDKARSTLSPTGYRGLVPGMDLKQAEAVARASGEALPRVAGTGRVVVRWRDCDLVFQDGVLVGIAAVEGTSTLDGIRVGDPVSKAVDLYGRASVEQVGTHWVATFLAERALGTGFRVTFAPGATGAGLSGTIVGIELCLCRPAPPPPCDRASGACSTVAWVDVDGDGVKDGVGVELGVGEVTVWVSTVDDVYARTLASTYADVGWGPEDIYVGAWSILRKVGAELVLDVHAGRGGAERIAVLTWDGDLVMVPAPGELREPFWPPHFYPAAWAFTTEYVRKFVTCTRTGGITVEVQSSRPDTSIPTDPTTSTTGYTWVDGAWSEGSTQTRPGVSGEPWPPVAEWFSCPTPVDDATGGQAPNPAEVAPTLGLVWAPHQEGYGTAMPSFVYNGGSGAGALREVKWDSWGGAEATGTGTGWVGGADGRTAPARVVASDLGLCHGQRAYRTVTWFYESETRHSLPPTEICPA